MEGKALTTAVRIVASLVVNIGVQMIRQTSVQLFTVFAFTLAGLFWL